MGYTFGVHSYILCAQQVCCPTGAHTCKLCAVFCATGAPQQAWCTARAPGGPPAPQLLPFLLHVRHARQQRDVRLLRAVRVPARAAQAHGPLARPGAG